jgi:hypothetical protein
VFFGILKSTDLQKKIKKVYNTLELLCPSNPVGLQNVPWYSKKYV